MSFKTFYCIKASNNVVMTFQRIDYYDEQMTRDCNIISIFNVNIQ